jgi:quinol monooxygenase YgiN
MMVIGRNLGGEMGTDTKYARLVITEFKEGKRDEGNEIVEGFLKEGVEGLLGYTILDSLDDPDKSIYTTFWESEEAMVRSLGEIKETLFEALEDISVGAIEFLHNKVRVIEYPLTQVR